MSHPQEDWSIPLSDRIEDFPRWKVWGFNALAVTVGWLFVGLVGAALWALWTHMWLVPIIAVPLLAWAFISAIAHP